MDGIPIQWIQSLRTTTKTLVLSSVALSLIEYLILDKPIDLSINSNNFFKLSTIWKLPLNMVYMGKFSFMSLSQLYFFTEYSNELESLVNSSIDYAYMIFVITFFLVIYSIKVTNLNILSYPLRDILIYIWAKKNPNVEMRFILFQIKSKWYPWVTLSLDTIFGNYVNILNKLSPIMLGHVFWYLSEMLPKIYGVNSFLLPFWKWNRRNNINADNDLIEDDDEEENMVAIVNPEDTEELPQNENVIEIDQNDQNDQIEELEETYNNLNNAGFQRETQDTLNHI